MENENEVYGSFAQVYEELMDNVPYEAWGEKIKKILGEYGIRDGLVLDLCCGTGVMTRYLADSGYDMIGIDASEEMLAEAMEQEAKEEREQNILYLLQDMREFELYGTVQAVVCVCDSLNYLLETEELSEVFRLVNNYLEAGGIFIFDMNTEYKFREVMGERCIAENREHVSFIWNNEYDEASKINEYELTLFLECEDGRYEKQEEYHYERAYTPEEIKTCLNNAGLELLSVFDDYTDDAPGETCERMVFVARESYQEGKTYQ